MSVSRSRRHTWCSHLHIYAIEFDRAEIMGVPWGQQMGSNSLMGFEQANFRIKSGQDQGHATRDRGGN